MLVENESPESIKNLIGHIVDVDNCYSQNRKIFKENLTKALNNKYNQTIRSIARVDKHESFVFMQNLRKKF